MAAIFRPPWEPAHNGDYAVGLVKNARTATFRVLGFAKVHQGPTRVVNYFRVEILTGHASGEAIGWLPERQVCLWKPDPTRAAFDQASR